MKKRLIPMFLLGCAVLISGCSTVPQRYPEGGYELESDVPEPPRPKPIETSPFYK